MTFWIEIKDNYKTYRYPVEHKIVDAKNEHFTLKANNKTIIIESNRPYFRSHPGLKKRKPEMQILQGTILNISFRDKIFDAIAARFDSLPIVRTP